MTNLNNTADTLHIRHVPLTRPFIWLRSGWDDILHHCAASLAYGLLVSVLGALILAYNQHPFYIAAVCIGFMLVGPIMTAGCCELSRLQEAGEQADFQDSLRPMQRNRGGLLTLAQALALLALIWIALSTAIYSGVIGAPAPAVAAAVGGDILLLLSGAQIMAYLTIGLVLSAVVFALTVVAVPMIVERHVDARTAMRTSVKVTLRELPAMMLWAALIVLLLFVAFSTSLVGMVFIFPLLAHATWHAYRELVT